MSNDFTTRLIALLKQHTTTAIDTSRRAIDGRIAGVGAALTEDINAVADDLAAHAATDITSAHPGPIDDTMHGARGGGALHATATTGAAGFMAAADKDKLDDYPDVSGLTIGHVLQATGAATVAFAPLTVITVSWDDVTGTPTTIAGYGITDDLAIIPASPDEDRLLYLSGGNLAESALIYDATTETLTYASLGSGAPTALRQITLYDDANASARGIALRQKRNAATGMPIVFSKSRDGGGGLLAENQSGDELGVLQADGWTALDGWLSDVASVAFVVEGASGGGSLVPTGIAFRVRDSGGAGSASSYEVGRFTHQGALRMREGSAPSAPPSGFTSLYIDSTGLLATVDDSGATRALARRASAASAGRIAFWNGASDLSHSSALYWDNSVGDLWIGMTASLAGTGYSSARRYFGIRGASGASSIEVASTQTDADNTIMHVFQASDANSSAGDKRIAGFAIRTDGTTANNRGGAIGFHTKADGVSSFTERMRITQNGFVAIGLNGVAPTQMLDVAGGARLTRDDGLYNLRINRAAATAREFGFAIVSGELILDDITVSQRIAQFAATGGNASLMLWRGAGTSGTLVVKGTSHATHFHYSTSEDIYLRAGKTGATIHMQDNHNGSVQMVLGGGWVSVGVGAVAGVRLLVRGHNASAGSYALSVQNSTPANLMYVENNGTLWANVAWTISDAREKTQIADISPREIDALGRLRVRRYVRKITGVPELGFIAQEVRTVRPDMVRAGKDGVLGIRSGDITALLVAAYQREKARGDQLEARLSALEARFA